MNRVYEITLETGEQIEVEIYLHSFYYNPDRGAFNTDEPPTFLFEYHIETDLSEFVNDTVEIGDKIYDLVHSDETIIDEYLEGK